MPATITHVPSLVLLSITIAILGCFTACVLTSGYLTLPRPERRLRLIMASLALGGSIWAQQFVGLLAIDAPVNWTLNPWLFGIAAVIAWAGTLIALLTMGSARSLPLAVAVLGVVIAATQYLGLGAIASKNLRISWFLTAICVAVSLQAASVMLWFLFRKRGVAQTFLGATALGLALSAPHFVAVASAEDFYRTLALAPQPAVEISARYLAWSATIVMYLIYSLCLCIHVVMQFREDL